MDLHHLHPELLKHRIRVLVVGCGGDGSAIAAGFPYLHQALLAYGHLEGSRHSARSRGHLADKLRASALQPI